MSQCSRGHSRQKQGQAFVAVGSQIADAGYHDEADTDCGGSEPHTPRPATRILWGDDSRDADQNWRFAERSQVVECVKGGVELLSQQDGRDRESDRCREGHHEESGAVGRRWLSTGHSRIDDAELLALLRLLHVLGELGFSVSLHQRVIELTSALVVAGELYERLLATRHVLDSLLIRRDGCPEPTLFPLEDLELRLQLAEALFQTEQIRRDGRRRRLCVRGGFLHSGLGGRKLTLKSGDLGRQQNHVGIVVIELNAEPRALLLFF